MSSPPSSSRIIVCSVLRKVRREREGKKGGGKREEGRGKREEGRGKREEGRGKREEGRGKREEGEGRPKPFEKLSYLRPIHNFLLRRLWSADLARFAFPCVPITKF
jgi:hypothetical protein